MSFSIYPDASSYRLRMSSQPIRLTTSTLSLVLDVVDATMAGEPVWGFKICERAKLGCIRHPSLIASSEWDGLQDHGKPAKSLAAGFTR